MTDVRVEAIRERLAAATPGPWRDSSSAVKAEVRTFDGLFIADCGPPGLNGADRDVDFIASAPTDIAFLLERLEQVEASEARLADAVGLLLTDYGGPTSIGHMQRATSAGREALHLRPLGGVADASEGGPQTRVRGQDSGGSKNP